MDRLLARLRRALGNHEGATAVEYAIMVALISAVIIGAVIVLGDEVEGEFNCTADKINAPATNC